ncbi:MAG: prephenate dehydratase [Lactobacillales bacterium]|jgi:prephenate dehydratase|nr:prephenate dehydratase [Lactobacillales bacterium]
MKIAYLGPKGSFSYLATQQVYGKEELMSYFSITDCLAALENGEVDTAVVPIENSVEGVVSETIDYLFHHSQLKASCELVLPVVQNFLVHPHNKDSKLIKILSHPQAISQSRKFLLENYLNVPIWHTPSTAKAAEYVMDHPEEPVAAIGSQVLAEQYGMLILHQSIQEMEENHTRFWVLGKVPQMLLSVFERKCTLAFTLEKNVPGSLYSALSMFASREINLTKIESRPLRTVLGEYFFIVDCLEFDNKQCIKEAIEEMTEFGNVVKVLGSYDVVRLSIVSLEI